MIAEQLNAAKRAGFTDPRAVESKPITVENPELEEKLGDLQFFSVTYRLFKLEGLEEALLADGLEVFGSFDEGLLVVAGGADEFRHDFLLYNVMIIIKDSIQ